MARSIEERTEFLSAANFCPEDDQKIEDIMEWLSDNPFDAASYIVWLERQQEPKRDGLNHTRLNCKREE